MNDKLPKVILQLVGENGNAFAIMGRWQRAAKRAGWPPAEIARVLAEMRSGDYDHLLQTVMANSEEPNEDVMEEEDEE